MSVEVEASASIVTASNLATGTYMTWAELETMTWDEIEALTWAELEFSRVILCYLGIAGNSEIVAQEALEAASYLGSVATAAIIVASEMEIGDVFLGIAAAANIVATTSGTCRARLKPAPILAETKTFLVKIEWLSWDETTVTGEYTGYAVDGNINVDTSRESRRSFSATFLNSSRLFAPNGSLTNMGVKLRLSRGIVKYNGEQWWQKGIYILTDPEAAHKAADKTVSLQGLDKWALLDGTLGGTLTDTYQVANGTNVATAIRAILTDAGETKFRFDTCTVTTPYTITKEPGTTYAELLKELALIPSYELFYDTEGYAVFRPIVEATEKPMLWDFSVGGKYRRLYVSGSYKPEWSKIKNRWKVFGYSDSTLGLTYKGLTEDSDPNSPTNTASPPDGIGVKASVMTDTNLTSNALCAARAAYELKQNLKAWHRTSASFDFVPFLQEGECIQLEDLDAGIVDGKYEIQSITEPLGLGQYSVECWRVV